MIQELEISPMIKGFLFAEHILGVETSRLEQYILSLNNPTPRPPLPDNGIKELQQIMLDQFSDLKATLQSARQSERPVPAEAKDFLKDILQPPKTTKKLTKKQQIEERAAQITARDNLKLLQKHSKIRG
jgi:hypothetical protein